MFSRMVHTRTGGRDNRPQYAVLGFAKIRFFLDNAVKFC